MRLHGSFLLILLALALYTFPAGAQDGDDHQTVRIQFAAMIGKEAVACDTQYDDISLSENTVEIADYRLYVSNVRLITPDGEQVSLQLDQDSIWQHEGTALLDFEDGTGACETGNSDLNTAITGTVPDGDYTGLAFDVGVPFPLNHQDTTLAPSPLNLGAMFWNWQIGYKFIRIDLITDNAGLAPYNLHVGSTGCTSPAGAIPPQEICARPNVMQVTFDHFDVENDVVVSDLGQFLSSLDLSSNTPEPPGCMSGFDDPDCPVVFANLGLSFENGQCSDDTCSDQQLFRVSPADSVPVMSTAPD